MHIRYLIIQHQFVGLLMQFQCKFNFFFFGDGTWLKKEINVPKSFSPPNNKIKKLKKHPKMVRPGMTRSGIILALIM